MFKDTTENKGLNLIYMAKNVLICFGITIILLFLMSLTSLFVVFDESVILLLVGAITYFSVGLCGFRAAKFNGSNGLVIGLISGIFYVLALYLAGSIVNMNFAINGSKLLTIGICTASGIIGGILGVNAKSKKRR